MNVRPRLLMGSFASVKTSISNKTKPPTHYETLELDPQATQNEIKSAYFKLSKQYHPDKNTSEAATAKFRDVAEAYEVLGSNETRRNYDRSILTRTPYPKAHEGAKPADPKIKYYQSQAAVFRQSSKTGSTPLYDFDAWTKAHYGRTLERTFKDRREAARKRAATVSSDVSYSGNKDIGIWVFAFVLVAVVISLGIEEPVRGEPALTIRQRNELDRNNKSDTKMRESSVDSLSK